MQIPNDPTGTYICAFMSTTNVALAARYDTRAEMNAAVAAFLNSVMENTSSQKFIRKFLM
jgi:hypothetical protein